MPEPEVLKRERGSGSIFQNGSAVWWIGYSERGIKHRENSHSTDHAVAERLLKRRLAEIETGVFVPKANTRIDELVADVMAEYAEKQQKSYDSVEQRWRLHLKPFFTKRKASDITTDKVRRYTKQRTDQGAYLLTRSINGMGSAYWVIGQLSLILRQSLRLRAPRQAQMS